MYRLAVVCDANNNNADGPGDRALRGCNVYFVSCRLSISRVSRSSFRLTRVFVQGAVRIGADLVVVVVVVVRRIRRPVLHSSSSSSSGDGPGDCC